MNSIKIKCDCGQIITIDLVNEELYWEIVETDEREMGVEKLHEAVLEYDCEQCGTTINITLHVWEYPEGFCNMNEILVDGGELVSECDLSNLFLENYGTEEE